MTTPSYIPNLRPTQIDNPTTFGRAIFCNPTLRNLSWVGEKVGQDRLARLKQRVKRGLGLGLQDHLARLEQGVKRSEYIHSWTIMKRSEFIFL